MVVEFPVISPIGYLLQRVDVGIVACHFHLTDVEKNCKPNLESLRVPPLSPRTTAICLFLGY